MFKLLNLIYSVYYAPVTEVTAPTGGNVSGGGGKHETIDLVSDLDFEKPEVIDLKKGKVSEKEEDKKEEKEDEEADVDDNKGKEEDETEDDDDLDELLDDIEEPTEEQLELDTPSSRRAILKEYPDLFKKFPSLEKSYYRDQKFTEHFATPAEALLAKDKVDVLDNFEKDIMAGNTEAIFKSVREGDPTAFHKVVDNLLPTLEKIDREAYLHIVANNIKEVIYHMWNTGKESNDEDLQNLARGVNKFMFGNEKYTPPTKLARDEPKVDTGKEAELLRKEREFTERQFNSSKNELMSRVDSQIKATINKHIDPKNSMPEYVKKNAIRDANEILESQLKNDKRFQDVLGRLWDNAKKHDFSKDSVDRVKQAYTSKASALLASVIKKARNEALKGIGKRVKEEELSDDSTDNETEEKSPRRVKPRPSNEGREQKGRVIPKGMTTAEWLALK